MHKTLLGSDAELYFSVYIVCFGEPSSIEMQGPLLCKKQKAEDLTC